MNSDEVWRAQPPGTLLLREWAGEVVVYNQRTGSTHLLGEFEAEVLRRLMAAEHGIAIDTLAAGLDDSDSGADREAWRGAIREVLSDFARLGLALPDKS